MKYTNTLLVTSLFSAVLIGIISCDKKASTGDQAKQKAPQPAVGVITAKSQMVELTKNLPGRLVSSRDAPIIARVMGIVEKQIFKEGAYVKASDKLFQIDDATFRASLASAKAQLKQAQATKRLNQVDVQRYRKLVGAKAVSRQTYEQAKTTLATTNASIQIAKVAIIQAQLNIDYASVSAPIDGYIGQALVTEGALVSAAVTQMAEIQQIDPLYINIKQPAGEMLKIKKMILSKSQQSKSSQQLLENHKVMVKVFLEDGSPYQYSGQLLFADVSVDKNTGQGLLRATLPNPQHLLMPGLYVRVEVPQIKIDHAFLVPQQAVTRNSQGDTVFVVNKDDSYAPRSIKIAQSKGNNWIVTEGLQAGDKIIMDGMQMVMITQAKKVTPVPWKAETKPKKGQVKSAESKVN
ncbi:MAG: efflux RND transporter periplasmic adaptor subunit [Ostreibacterium sp.]